jgi:hypothetical protein
MGGSGKTSNALKRMLNRIRLILQRNDSAGRHKVIFNLGKTDQGYSVLTYTVNSLELITLR